MCIRDRHVPLGWATDVRIAILVGANVWSAWLAWKVTGRYAAWPRRLAAFAWFAVGLAVVDSAWWLMFWGF